MLPSSARPPESTVRRTHQGGVGVGVVRLARRADPPPVRAGTSRVAVLVALYPEAHAAGQRAGGAGGLAVEAGVGGAVPGEGHPGHDAGGVGWGEGAGGRAADQGVDLVEGEELAVVENPDAGPADGERANGWPTMFQSPSAAVARGTEKRCAVSASRPSRVMDWPASRVLSQ